MWDLRKDPSISPANFGDSQSIIPHITKYHEKNDNNESMEIPADVSSVHWSNDGTRLLTSSNDKHARIWNIDEQMGSKIEIEIVKPFLVMLMNSKFNKPSQADLSTSHTQLVATGGHSGTVTIWKPDYDNASSKEIAKLNHA